MGTVRHFTEGRVEGVSSIVGHTEVDENRQKLLRQVMNDLRKNRYQRAEE